MREDPEYIRICGEFVKDAPNIHRIPLAFASWAIKRLALQEMRLARIERDLEMIKER